MRTAAVPSLATGVAARTRSFPITTQQNSLDTPTQTKIVECLHVSHGPYTAQPSPVQPSPAQCCERIHCHGALVLLRLIQRSPITLEKTMPFVGTPTQRTHPIRWSFDPIIIQLSSNAIQNIRYATPKQHKSRKKKNKHTPDPSNLFTT